MLAEQFRQVHLQACNVEEVSVVVEFDEEVVVAPVRVLVSGHRANQRYRPRLGAFRGDADRYPMSLEHDVATVHTFDCIGAVADGASWQRIGALLVVSESETQQRFDPPSELS